MFLNNISIIIYLSVSSLYHDFCIHLSLDKKMLFISNILLIFDFSALQSEEQQLDCFWHFKMNSFASLIEFFFFF